MKTDMVLQDDVFVCGICGCLVPEMQREVHELFHEEERTRPIQIQAERRRGIHRKGKVRFGKFGLRRSKG